MIGPQFSKLPLSFDKTKRGEEQTKLLQTSYSLCFNFIAHNPENSLEYLVNFCEMSYGASRSTIARAIKDYIDQPAQDY